MPRWQQYFARAMAIYIPCTRSPLWRRFSIRVCRIKYSSEINIDYNDQLI